MCSRSIFWPNREAGTPRGEGAGSKDGLFSFAQLLPSADSMRKCSSMKIMGWNLCRFGKVWKEAMCGGWVGILESGETGGEV